MNEIIVTMNVKRCAHCGGDASIEMVSSQYRVKCNQCEASTQLVKTPDEALCRWNRQYKRTCKPVTEVLETVDIGIGFLERLVDNCSDCGEPLTCDYSSNAPWRRVLPNYCSHCGAKVVE